MFIDMGLFMEYWFSCSDL